MIAEAKSSAECVGDGVVVPYDVGKLSKKAMIHTMIRFWIGQVDEGFPLAGEGLCCPRFFGGKLRHLVFPSAFRRWAKLYGQTTFPSLDRSRLDFG